VPWLPDDFVHPARLDLPTGHHLRPIRADDVELDLPAVLGSRQRLWSVYGPVWGWPPATMTHEQDREDLAHHVTEMEQREGYNYALFDDGETELLGCCYLYPPDKQVDADAESSWWVVDRLVGSDVERALATELPAWFARDWPLRRVLCIGHDVGWEEWRALPDR
jgi:RimJ/RimL family protein N-acetyltransferase